MAHVYDRRAEVALLEKEKAKPKAKKLESIRLKKSANGGLMAEHEFDNSGPGLGYHDRETHTFGKGEHRKAMEHVVKHLELHESGPTSGQANKSTDSDADDDKD